jgi:hypothetical protein
MLVGSVIFAPRLRQIRPDMEQACSSAQLQGNWALLARAAMDRRRAKATVLGRSFSFLSGFSVNVRALSGLDVPPACNRWQPPDTSDRQRLGIEARSCLTPEVGLFSRGERLSSKVPYCCRHVYADPNLRSGAQSCTRKVRADYAGRNVPWNVS